MGTLRFGEGLRLPMMQQGLGRGDVRALVWFCCRDLGRWSRKASPGMSSSADRCLGRAMSSNLSLCSSTIDHLSLERNRNRTDLPGRLRYLSGAGCTNARRRCGA